MKKYILLFLITYILLSISCHKDFDNNPADKKFPLELIFSNSSGKLHFSWKKVITNEFRRYLLVSSEMAIPIGMNPLQPTIPINIEVIYKHQDSISFIKEQNIDTLKFYKLYLEINNRFLESNQIQFPVHQKKLVGGSLYEFIIDKPGNNLIIIDYKNKNIEIYDYLKDSIINSKNLNVTSLTRISGSVGYEMSSSQKRLYLIINNQKLRTYNLPDLTLLKEETIESSIFRSNLIVTNKNTILYGRFDEDSTIILRRQNTLEYYNSHPRSDFGQLRGLALLDSSSNLIVEYSEENASTYTLNESDGSMTLINTIDYIAPGLLSINFTPVVSNDGNYFMPTTDAVIYDKRLNRINFDGGVGGCFTTTTADFSMDSKKILFAEYLIFSPGEVVRLCVNDVEHKKHLYNINLGKNYGIERLFCIQDDYVLLIHDDFLHDEFIITKLKF